MTSTSKLNTRIPEISTYINFYPEITGIINRENILEAFIRLIHEVRNESSIICENSVSEDPISDQKSSLILIKPKKFNLAATLYFSHISPIPHLKLNYILAIHTADLYSAKKIHDFFNNLYAAWQNHKDLNQEILITQLEKEGLLNCYFLKMEYTADNNLVNIRLYPAHDDYHNPRHPEFKITFSYDDFKSQFADFLKQKPF